MQRRYNIYNKNNKNNSPIIAIVVAICGLLICGGLFVFNTPIKETVLEKIEETKNQIENNKNDEDEIDINDNSNKKEDIFVTPHDTNNNMSIENNGNNSSNQENNENVSNDITQTPNNSQTGENNTSSDTNVVTQTPTEVVVGTPIPTTIVVSTPIPTQTVVTTIPTQPTQTPTTIVTQAPTQTPTKTPTQNPTPTPIETEIVVGTPIPTTIIVSTPIPTQIIVTTVPTIAPTPTYSINQDAYNNAESTKNNYGNLVTDCLNAINAERAALGISGVTLDNNLCIMSGYRVYDMATNQYFSHSKNGESQLAAVMNIYGASGKHYENLGTGYTSEERVVNGMVENWKKSTSHYGVIKDASLTKIGIAIAKDSNGQWYFCTIYS